LSEVLVEKSAQALAEGDRTGSELLAAEALTLAERPDARGLVALAESSAQLLPKLALPSIAGCSRYAASFTAGLVACARGEKLFVSGIHDAEPWATLSLDAPVLAMEFSADGRRLVVTRGDDAVLLLAVEKLSERPLLERHVGQASAVTLSASGRYLACASASGDVLLWDTEHPERTSRFELKQGVSALAFAPQGSRLIVAGALGRLVAWDFDTGHAADLTGHAGTVRALAFAQQGHYLVSGSADRTLRFWDLHDGSPAFQPITTPDAVTSVAWSPDGRVVAYGLKDKSFSVRDLKSSEAAAQVRYHDEAVELVALSPELDELLTVSRDVGAVVWSTAALKSPRVIVERSNVLALAPVPGTDELVSAGVGTNGVGIFKLATGTCETRLPAGLERVRALAVSKDGGRLAFAGSGARVFVWDLPSRMPLGVLDSARDDVRAVVFSDDMRWLAFAGLDRTIRVVDAKTFASVAELPGASALQSLTFSGASSTLWSADRDGIVTAWDVRKKQPLRRFKAHDDWVLGLAASADGRRLATASADRRVKIWDTESTKPLFELNGHEGRVLAVQFDASGQWLASAGEDKSVRIWNARTGEAVAILEGHTAAVRDLGFLADGRLVSGGDDGTLRLWQLGSLKEPGRLVRERAEKRYWLTLAGTRVVRAPSR
jgi:WD40 repeat protein